MALRIVGTLRAVGIFLLAVQLGCQSAREVRDLVHPEQTHIEFRAPESLPETPLPSASAPRTVLNPDGGGPQLMLSLDQAIMIALENSEVIRVLAGATATSSGQTIYDPAIVNATIDEARGRFDPNLSLNNTFAEDQTATGVFAPFPPGAAIFGTDAGLYNLDAQLSQTNPLGGTAGLRVGVAQSEFDPGPSPLNPRTSHFTEMSYVQPLLRGGGLEANLAPILVARLDTERSYFQFKDGMQELVRGVINGYWSLVFARTDRWAREQQVTQLEFAYERELARVERELGNLADLAQARLAVSSFRATLVAAESNVLQREAALLNVMGLSPTEVGEVIPTTPPHVDQLDFRWQELLFVAERYRPDIIELKLIIEADDQRRYVAENDAQPTLDAVALYRWDGLRGVTPAGPAISTNGGAHTDWTLGINFSVPIGLRQGRAALRRQDEIILRDRANLTQGLHSATHQLALDIRNLDQFYAQYVAFKDARDAARENLMQQSSEFFNGRTIFLNVLQAIASWGDAVSAEAQSLTQYNSELANLERDSGTILETHGVRFVEERMAFAGPLCAERCYPIAITPTANQPIYPVGDAPSEESFDLTNPFEEIRDQRREREGTPPPLPLESPFLPEPLIDVPQPDAGSPFDAAPRLLPDPIPQPEAVPDPQSMNESAPSPLSSVSFEYESQFAPRFRINSASPGTAALDNTLPERNWWDPIAATEDQPSNEN